MVTGLPGSGKTYFAKALADSIGGLHINSDIIRKDQHKHPAYAAADKATVYQTMFKKVRLALEMGKTVVVDATFSLQQYRLPYFNFAYKNSIPLKLMVIDADEHTIAKRLQKERPDSDADYEVFKKIKSEFEPLTREHLVLSSDKLTLEEMIRKGVDFMALTKRPDD